MSGVVPSNGITSLFTSNPKTSFDGNVLNYSVQNSNSVTILLGATPIAFGQSVEWGISFGLIPIKGIGSAKPQELLQDNLTAIVTVDSLVMVPSLLYPNASPSANASVLGSGTQTINIVMTGNSPLDLAYFTDCTCDQFLFSVRTNQPLTQRMTFFAMDVLDEFGISILQGDTLLRLLATAQQLTTFSNTLSKLI